MLVSALVVLLVVIAATQLRVVASKPWSYARRRVTMQAITLVTALAVLLMIQVASSQQFTAALRLSPCVGLSGGGLSGPLCNVTGFFEAEGRAGVFAQVTPRLGPFYDNWQVYVYRPNVRFDALGVQWVAWPGVAAGRELGEWFVRAQADLVISIEWGRD